MTPRLSNATLKVPKVIVQESNDEYMKMDDSDQNGSSDTNGNHGLESTKNIHADDHLVNEFGYIFSKEGRQPKCSSSVGGKAVIGEENFCTLDLRNLLAINSHQINYQSLYQSEGEKQGENGSFSVNVKGAKKAKEGQLLRKASDGCSQILSGLWELEKEKTDTGTLAILPSYFEYKIPRELPPPQPRAETKWEKFAKERGIAPKGKRSRKVWDEATQSWAHLTGYHRVSSENPESWPIMEVKGSEDPYEDPWKRARDAKKDRVEKNITTRMRNEERVGNLVKGFTSRTMKAKKAAREGELPLEIISTNKQLGKDRTKVALLAAQTSTASLGKFDRMREGEPERRKVMKPGFKKRKIQTETINTATIGESKKDMKVLENILIGGGEAKEKSIRRGDFSKGETGYDYDYNDGLGVSSFKKKKGKAGVGKMKKVTRKRVK